MSPAAPRLHTSPWQFVGKPSWPRGDCTASHFLQFLPSACRHGYLSPVGSEVEVGWDQFCQVFLFPDAGQPEELSLLVLFQKRPRGQEVLGCGRVDKAPLRSASWAGWELVRERQQGGGEGDRAAGPECADGRGYWFLARPFILSS